MSSFKQAADQVLRVEGAYSNHASDAGGKTMWGITEAVARANGYQGDMRNLTVEFALSIYKSQYWDTLRLDEVAEISQVVAEELFDTAVNCGVGVAGKFLQTALNSLNQQATIYPDTKVDGVVGPVSVHLLKQFMAKRGAKGEVVLMKALNCLQGARYIAIAEARPANEDFVFGWFSRISL